MSSLEEYNKNKSNAPKPKGRKKRDHPTGFEPGYRIKGDKGEIVSEPQKESNINHYDDILKQLELDPKKYEVIEPVEVRSWDSPTDGGTRLFYYKARIQSLQPVSKGDPDYDALLKEVKKVKKPKKRAVDKGESIVFCWSDWQIGKPDGKGTEAIVDRLTRMIPDFITHVETLRASGKKIENLYILSLGDIIENCAGFYPNMTYGVELNLRDQVKVARRIMVKALTEWSPLFKNVVVCAIAGNHGENRDSGKTFTNFADNHDVAVVEQVQEILEQNPKAFGHVKFYIPEEELSATIEISGKIVGFAHGHQFRSGVSVKTGRFAFDKGIKWFAGQCMGREPIGDADLLVWGHFHHYIKYPNRGSWFIQAPSMDDGSKWFKDMTGDEAPPGQVSFTISSKDEGYFIRNEEYFPFNG